MTAKEYLIEAGQKIQRVYNPLFIQLLTDKYISGLTLEQIAEKYDKSVETVKLWHKQALETFEFENNIQNPQKK